MAVRPQPLKVMPLKVMTWNVSALGLLPRIDPWYLKEGDFPDKLREGAKKHFEDNLGSVTSAGILWEAFKTVRGQALALLGGLKKECCLKCEIIEGEVSKLDAEILAGGLIQQHHCNLLLLKQQELTDLVDNSAHVHALATQRRLYDVGDRANRLLAWLEKRNWGRNWVMGIRDEAGDRRTTGDDIPEAFATYYEQVYSAKTDQPYENYIELLGDLPMMELRADDREVLDQGITVEEVVGGWTGL
ncbi:hypothetical protein NDU88_002802 [Pleurodeles waltl]|uniref:Uncharacterized protein n=1 Tax=Pleurodeles waltl TaxID=8319 RepID=A0AAV7LL60_PLEWA|nr:hypothetical protein NDU88_002802 [Pleurodeles waltl]